MAQPYLVSWNLTYRCNLRCAHCYLDASSEPASDELTAEEALNLLGQLSALSPGAMVIFSGGEPLLREDLYRLVACARDKGLFPVVGTNGTLLDDETAMKLSQAGARGVGLSLDSVAPAFHDGFRGVEGSWARAVEAARACRRQRLPFQIQATVTKDNQEQVPGLMDLAHELGAQVFNLFFLVCTGRGQGLTDISSQDYEAVLQCLAQAQGKYTDMLVRARCAPQFARVLAEERPPGSPDPGPSAGCLAARGYFRITPHGDVTPCPYLPLAAGNVRQAPLAQILETSLLMRELRGASLRDKCGACGYAQTCRGCRARAYATSGDYLGEDPWCAYEPKAGAERSARGSDVAPTWTSEARKRMEGAPFFIRGLVQRRIEEYAQEKGYPEITVEVLAEVRAMSPHAIMPFVRGKRASP